MTPDQIRARLQVSGYPANLLDAYFGAAVPGQAAAAPSVTELAAIQARGPGSEVFVPVRDTTERVNYTSLVTSIVQIIASTVTAIYVIKHL
jgi:hypothetical protein